MNAKILTKQGGFTLLELLLVISVIGVLASIGAVRYQNYIIDARRHDAVANLQMAQQAMERYFLRNSSYFSGLTNKQLELFSSDSHKVTVSVDSTKNTYILTSTPTKNYLDEKCGALSITESGLKKHHGAASDVSECWR